MAYKGQKDALYHLSYKLSSPLERYSEGNVAFGSACLDIQQRRCLSTLGRHRLAVSIRIAPLGD
ncbi:hypothetical protein HMPREF1869_00096 [Bacteroidales bacterium KA00251]|nr:hypothetical protein HMPREF1869_00096 [Bacteroidales bacterium KA00251]